ncbi:MAG: hypothetical protein DI626_10625 [Micavibrio aeruginosavorus]|uniref:Uncharacterized protein n=1 Tax=Micavibrio aeruginosavorus TaxID=349221 RepID=A0A2W5BKH5_9BACT|nr:MAG: hypothetical protein DI626_10625 [Micavibrio aeruginosavorus]
MKNAAHYEKLQLSFRAIQLYLLEILLAGADSLYKKVGAFIVVVDCIYLDMKAKGLEQSCDFIASDLVSAQKK